MIITVPTDFNPLLVIATEEKVYNAYKNVIS